MAKDCFIEAVGRWLSHEDGTGDNPHPWETVFNKKKLLTLLDQEDKDSLKHTSGIDWNTGSVLGSFSLYLGVEEHIRDKYLSTAIEWQRTASWK